MNSTTPAPTLEMNRQREILRLRAELADALGLIADLQAANEILRKRLIPYEAGR